MSKERIGKVSKKGDNISYNWTIRKRKIKGIERDVRIRRRKGKLEVQVIESKRKTTIKPKPKVKVKSKPKPIPIKLKAKPKEKTKSELQRKKEKLELQRKLYATKKKIIKLGQGELDPNYLKLEYPGLPFDMAITAPQNMEQYNLAEKYLKLRIKQSKMKIKELGPKQYQKGKGGKTIWKSDIHYKIMDEEEHLDTLKDDLENLEIIKE